MTHTNTEAVSDERLAEFLLDYAKRAGAIGIPGSIVPILTKAGEALSRRSASNTGGVEVKARQALAVYGKWAVDVATLGELGDLEARMTAVGVTLQDVGEWSNPPSLAAEAEPVAWPLGSECPACHGTGQPGGVLGGPELGLCHRCEGRGYSAEVTVTDEMVKRALEAKQSAFYGVPSGPFPGPRDRIEMRAALAAALSSINGGRENG